jgi:hypothetical protein
LAFTPGTRGGGGSPFDVEIDTRCACINDALED